MALVYLLAQTKHEKRFAISQFAKQFHNNLIISILLSYQELEKPNGRAGHCAAEVHLNLRLSLRSRSAKRFPLILARSENFK